MNQDQMLTKNQSLVLRVLARSTAPLSAYAILDQLRGNGMRAPLQIYRALEKLMDFGLVHRLESLNAFIACRHKDCDTHETVAFTICKACGTVCEIGDHRLAGRLQALADMDDFTVERASVELRGTCRACMTNSATGQGERAPA